MSYRAVAEIDAEGHTPDEICTMTEPYVLGRLVRGRFADILAYGRSLGLLVEDFRGGSNLIEVRGQLRIKGRWADVRKVLLAIEELR